MMMMTPELWAIALRGAADALSAAIGADMAKATPEAPAVPAPPAPPAKPTLVPPAAPPQAAPPQAAPSQAAPSQAAPPQAVSREDVVTLYQKLAQQGTPVDMPALLEAQGVQKLGECSEAQVAAIYQAMQEAAGG